MLNNKVIIISLGLLFLILFSSNTGAFHGVFPLNLSNNVSIIDIYPFNITNIRGTIEFNMSVQHLPGFAAGRANISNVTFILVNQTGSINGGNLTMGINRTHNLTVYSVKNSTTSLLEGNWSIKLIITAQHEGGNYTNDTDTIGPGHNFTIDNTPPTITINKPVNTNQTNTTVDFDFTVTDNSALVFNCSLGADSARLNVTFNATNGSGTFRTNNFSQVLFDNKFTFTITCADLAEDINMSNATRNIASASSTVTVDTVSPFTLPIEFRDKNGNVKTEFGFGDEVTIDCNPKDNTTGVEPAKIVIGLIEPDSASEQNISAGNIGRSNDTLSEVKLTTTDTQILGDFTVICHLFDYVGLSNKTNSTLKIIEKVIKSTSAFTIPGFSSPVGKTKVSTGVTSDIGAIPTEGVSRLLATGSSLKFKVNNVDHKLTVISASEESLTLRIESTPFEVTVNAGAIERVDIDKDGISDLEITFHKMFPPGGKWADVTIKAVSAAVQEEEREEAEREEAEKVPEEAGFKPSQAPLIVTIVVIVIIIVIGFVLIRGKKK